MISQVAPYEIIRCDKYEVPTESPVPLENRDDQDSEQIVDHQIIDLDLQSYYSKGKVCENWRLNMSQTDAKFYRSQNLFQGWPPSSLGGQIGHVSSLFLTWSHANNSMVVVLSCKCSTVEQT